MASANWKKLQIKEFNERWYYKKNRFAFLRRLDVVSRILSKFSQKLVLDVGTADGEIPVKLIKSGKFDSKILGIDISRDLIYLAKKITKKYNLTERVQYIIADSEYLPFRDAIFNSIICTAVLEHLFNLQNSINEMSRACKEKKFIIITIPNFMYHNLLRFLAVLRLRYRDSVRDAKIKIEKLEEILSENKLNTIFRSNFVLPLPNFLNFVEKFLARLQIKGFHLLLNQLLICKKE